MAQVRCLMISSFIGAETQVNCTSAERGNVFGACSALMLKLGGWSGGKKHCRGPYSSVSSLMRGKCMIGFSASQDSNMPLNTVTVNLAHKEPRRPTRITSPIFYQGWTVRPPDTVNFFMALFQYFHHFNHAIVAMPSSSLVIITAIEP